MSGETEDAAPAETLDAAAEELPTTEEALAWLAGIKPAAMLALLKDPEFRFAVAPAFGGFRPDAKGFANPLVRSRLAQAAAKDAPLAAKIRQLSETEAKAPAQPSEPKPAKTAPIPSASPDPLPALRAERDARRRERDEARALLAQAQSERDEAIKARRQVEGEREEAQRFSRKQAERIARLERQVTQARQVEARLVKALNEDKVAPPAPGPRRPGPALPEPHAIDSAWPVAVRHLLDRGKFETASALAEDVLKTDGEDVNALEIAARAWEGRKEPRLALGPVRRLLALHLREKKIAAAADTLLTVFRLVAGPEQAETEARQFLAALPATDPAAVAAGRLMLARLRGSSPAAYEWLAAYVISRTALGPMLMPPAGAFGPDDALPLPKQAGQAISARNLIDAVDQAESMLVDAAREALRGLEAAAPETYARIWAALEQAASDDPARLRALRREPRGAAVVDGSNVAWFDQESLVQGHPRLRHVIAMRRALWERGFFPVILYTDANLPYFIDDKPALLAMRRRRELTFVDAGTAADEVLLRVAKQRNAPLITNDKMEDWDPEGTVRKVRYAISMNGEAHLLSEV